MAEPNWADQTIWTGDNLDIMRGMNSESVDLIYLDPPFNSKANYAAPIGSKAAGAAFKDTWGLDDINLAWHGEIKHEHPGLYALLTATREIHGDSMMSYLIYMAIRVIEMKRLMKDTGSIYLHCDPTASHYLKLMMAGIFGHENFQSEVIWKRTSAHNSSKRWGPIHDVILFYSASKSFKWNRVYQSYDQDYIDRFYKHTDAGGRRYRTSDLTADGSREGESGEPWRGISPSSGRHWAVPRSFPGAAALPRSTAAALDRLDEMGRVAWPKSGGKPQFKRYLHEQPGTPIGDVIGDILPVAPRAVERTGYPTQKPLALLHRIIEASSNPGDVVLDPFCGCATACIAAEQQGREWIGIDISAKAAELVQSRMRDELGMFYKGAHRIDMPRRTDMGKVIRYNDAKNKRHLYGEQGGYCNGCESHFELRHYHVDHIIPRAKGGTDHISNLQLLCGHCNSIKGDRPHEYLLVCLTDKGWIKRKKAA